MCLELGGEIRQGGCQVERVVVSPWAQCPCKAASAAPFVGSFGRREQGEHPGEQGDQCTQVLPSGLRCGLRCMVETAQERSAPGVQEDSVGLEVAVDEAGPVDLAERPTQGCAECGTFCGTPRGLLAQWRKVVAEAERHGVALTVESLEGDDAGELEATQDLDLRFDARRLPGVGGPAGAHHESSSWSTSEEVPRLPGRTGMRPPMSIRSGRRSRCRRRIRASCAP